jgi:hypothetical protein
VGEQTVGTHAFNGAVGLIKVWFAQIDRATCVAGDPEADRAARTVVHDPMATMG